jgi:outer membrane protein assembly factor BamB
MLPFVLLVVSCGATEKTETTVVLAGDAMTLAIDAGDGVVAYRTVVDEIVRVVAVDVATGEELWSSPDRILFAGGDHTLRAPVAIPELSRIYTVDTDPTHGFASLFSQDSRTGEVDWVGGPLGFVQYPSVCDDGSAVCVVGHPVVDPEAYPDGAPTLFRIDPETGDAEHRYLGTPKVIGAADRGRQGRRVLHLRLQPAAPAHETSRP